MQLPLGWLSITLTLTLSRTKVPTLWQIPWRFASHDICKPGPVKGFRVRHPVICHFGIETILRWGQGGSKDAGRIPVFPTVTVCFSCQLDNPGKRNPQERSYLLSGRRFQPTSRKVAHGFPLWRCALHSHTRKSTGVGELTAKQVCINRPPELFPTMISHIFPTNFPTI